MKIFITIYDTVLWKPLLNGLIFLYNSLPWQDLGLAIVIFTLLIRIILIPLFLKARDSQKKLTLIQPEIKKIQERFKNDREGQSKALMELYAKHQTNPFSGCLVMLIQLPLLIALFQVLQKIGEVKSEFIYSFIKIPEIISPISFGILDLSKGNLYLGVVAAVSQFVQIKMTMKPPVAGDKSDNSKSFNNMLQKQTLYVLPVLVLVWSYTFPAALILYWTIFNIVGILQEIIWKDKPR
ncbi:MAG: YidC/Oxa1 family membrane protein insertase [Patescibacteria group bacterium]